MSFPSKELFYIVHDMLIIEELNFDRQALLIELKEYLQTITDEQRKPMTKLLMLLIVTEVVYFSNIVMVA